jgi:ATP-dependent DNA helicase RecQ
MVENFRSKRNLVEFTNQFAEHISHRLKSTWIQAKQADNGQIKLVRYQNDNLIPPVVNDILGSPLAGTPVYLPGPMTKLCR